MKARSAIMSSDNPRDEPGSTPTLSFADQRLIVEFDLHSFELQRLKVGRSLRDMAVTLFPTAFVDTVDGRFYKRMLEYLIRSPRLDEKTGQIMMPAFIVAHLDGKKWNRNFNAGNRLIAFELATDMSLTMSSWRYKENKARTVLPCWPDAFNAALDADLACAGTTRERVYFDTGEVYGRAHKKKEREQIELLVAKANASRPPTPQQQSLLEWLNAQNHKTLHRYIRQGWKEALAIAHALPETTTKEGATKQHTLMILDEIESDASLQYRTSEKTSRLHAHGANLTQLPKKIRKVLLGSGVSLDLVAAQAALIAWRWGCPKLDKLLTSERSFWEVLMQRAGLPAEVKGVVKKALYSAAFGMTPSHIVEEFKARLIDLKYPDDEASKIALRFRTSIIMREVLLARSRRLRFVNNQNGLFDAFDVWFAVDAPRANRYDQKETRLQLRKERHQQLRTALAVEMQSYEQYIMLAMEPILCKERISLLCWLHDGIVIKARDANEQARIVKRLCEAVTARAQSLGVKTCLEAED